MIESFPESRKDGRRAGKKADQLPKQERQAETRIAFLHEIMKESIPESRKERRHAVRQASAPSGRKDFRE
jgi:prophage antirepressor-like protein